MRTPQRSSRSVFVWGEHDNLRAVLVHFEQSGEAEMELRLCWALGWFWLIRGSPSEGRRRLEGALKRGSGVSAAVRAKALHGAGWMAWRQGDYDRMAELWEESLTLFRELGDKWGIARLVRNLGYVAAEQDDLGQAAELFEEGLALAREQEDKEVIAHLLEGLGQVEAGQGDLGQAAELYEESLTLQRELRDKGGIALCLEGLAGVACANGRPERAARLFGAAEALHEAIGFPLPSIDRTLMDYDRNVSAVRAELGEEAFAIAWAEGQAMPLEQAIAHALEKVGNS
ncbi:MAG: tetratricopeptide repeat protein [Candidatus Bipolaricaulia bacterium]